MINYFFIRKHRKAVQKYLEEVYEKPPVYPTTVAGSRAFINFKDSAKEQETSGIKYQDRRSDTETESGLRGPDYDSKYNAEGADRFDANVVSETIMRYLSGKTPYKPIGALANQTFTEKLLQIIREKDVSAPDVYKPAQMDRKLYSKIISDKYYKPSKDTVLALIFSLKLALSDAKDLLERAGFTLSHSINRDIVLEYFINEKVYNLEKINAFLYDIKEKTIGRNN